MPDSRKRNEDETSTGREDARSVGREGASLENYWLLLDDLEIHREELRHRADELDEAHSALEAVEDLLAEAPLGYVTTDASGTIRECNPTAGRILGLGHLTAPGWSLSAFVARGQKRRLFDHLLMARKTSGPVKTEITLESRDGSLVSAQLVSRSHSAEDFLTFRTAILNLTDRRHIEEALRTTERRLSAAVEASGTGIFELEVPFKGLLYLSHPLAEILGYPRSELAEPLLLPSWIEKNLHVEDAALLRGVYAEIGARARDSFQGDVRFRHKDGGRRWIRIWAKASSSGEAGSVDVVGAVMDVTAEKERTIETERRAKQLRALAAELHHVEERERKALAAELHDNLAQLIVATKMKLGVIGALDDDNALRQQQMDESLELLDRANEMVRSLTLNLSPPILDELGLSPALNWLAKDIERQFGLEVHLEERGELTLSDARLRFMLFRSIRELLINCAKHAQTKRAWVLLQAEAGGIRVVVEDHGEGFDLDRVRSEGSKGFGLFSIQERVESSGGEMHVRSGPGQGTTIALRLASPEQPSLRSQEDPMGLDAPRRRATPYPAPQRIRVLLADDHELVRSSLARLLEAQTDLEVIGEASDGESAIELARLLTPDVILMDVTMSGVGGIEATRRISSEHPESRVVGLSMHESADIASAMKNAGAFEYLLKSDPPRRLLETIRRAAFDARGSSR